jgi:uncharacterized protein (DUF697 family)
LAGLIPIPGAASVALVAAIGAQSDLIYKPLARELAVVYNSDVDEKTRQIVNDNLLFNGAADIANEFGAEFMMSIFSELITEAGLGATFGLIPIVGGLIGAALDYVIATAMTWRVGTMVAIYYQNGGKWVGDRKRTLELAKEMTGGVKFGMKDLMARFTRNNRQDLNVNLNSIPTKIPEVFGSQVRSLRPFVDMLLKAANSDFVRSQLRAQGFPPSIIDEVLKVAAMVVA